MRRAATWPRNRWPEYWLGGVGGTYGKGRWLTSVFCSVVDPYTVRVHGSCTMDPDPVICPNLDQDPKLFHTVAS